MGIEDGEPHDGRAPDYDDWTTPTSADTKGLNGDILVWNPVLEKAFELSSMGIRVDAAALEHQLKLRSAESRSGLFYHSELLKGSCRKPLAAELGNPAVHVPAKKEAYWRSTGKHLAGGNEKRIRSAGIHLL